MKYFDLHCDTLVKMEENGLDFSSEKLHVNKERTKIFEEYRQVFAFFTDDALPPSDAGDRFSRTIKRLEDTENVIPYFAVEGGGVLENELDNISRIELFAPCFFSLCWNGETLLPAATSKTPKRG